MTTWLRLIDGSTTFLDGNINGIARMRQVVQNVKAMCCVIIKVATPHVTRALKCIMANHYGKSRHLFDACWGSSRAVQQCPLMLPESLGCAQAGIE
jgi:hypothetical protein